MYPVIHAKVRKSYIIIPNMNQLSTRYETLVNEVKLATKRLGLDSLRDERRKLIKQSQLPDFWVDNTTAQSVMKRIGELEQRLQPWQQLTQDMNELKELLETEDSSLSGELETFLSSLTGTFSSLKSELKLAGQYDDHGAIVSIHAGAGGTDAQDWAQMLYRMYVRWSEAHQIKVTQIEESVGEEAGLKSVIFKLEGSFVYGKLKSEHGVHRLVRLSPFNSDNLRQTSFAKVEVMPKIDAPEEVQIDEKDLKLDVYRSGGHGGQSVNTTDSAVRITHLPSGIVVAIQNERSQLQNKETAMTILRSKLAQLQTQQHAKSLRELKGPNEQAAWGNQIRSYVLHPYKQVKDLRTRHESSDPGAVLNGEIDSFIDAYLEANLGQ